jgi:hypothetical protein
VDANKIVANPSTSGDWVDETIETIETPASPQPQGIQQTTIIYYQTVTDSDIQIPGNSDEKALALTAPGGADLVESPIGASDRGVHFHSPAGSPGLLDWPNGLYAATFEIKSIDGATKLVIDIVDIKRVTSTGTIIQSATLTGIPGILTVGTYTGTFNDTEATFNQSGGRATTDRFQFRILVKGESAQTFGATGFTMRVGTITHSVNTPFPL